MSKHFKLSKIMRYLDYSRIFIQRAKSSSKRTLLQSSIARMRLGEVVEDAGKSMILPGKSMTKNVALKTGGSSDGRLPRSSWQIFLVLMRVIVITLMASLLLTLYYLCPRVYSAALVPALEFLGSTFIKLGQWASTRRDLFSEDICDALAHLQRQGSTHSWMYTECLMSATFGSQWEEFFRRIDKKPIGSGCCAQVHKAWIRKEALSVCRANDNPHLPSYLHILEQLHLGFAADFVKSRFSTKKFIPEDLQEDELVPVVVKVVHPAVEAYVETDLFMIELLSVLTSYLVPSSRWLDLPGCVKEFSNMMLNQLDMRLEADNLQRFFSNFSRNPAVVFPTPVRNLTTRKILVESYHEGKHISEYLNLSDREELKKKLVKIAIPLVLKMVFEDNFFHCDLHPGNILVQEEDVLRRINKIQLHQRILPFCFDKAPRLVILDCGLVSSLTDRCLQNLHDVLHSIAMGDGARAGEYLMRHSSHMTPDPSGFKTAIENIVNRHMANKFSLQNVNLTALMREFYSALIHYKVQQDSAFINVVLSVLLIEGLGRSLDASNDILQEIIPFFR